ncbi:MAG TPA: hypothetical protein VII69_08770 [Candidatus Eremiobacteraceae bacterium]
MIQFIGLIVEIVTSLLSGAPAHVTGAPAGVSGGGPVGRPLPHPQPISVRPAIVPIPSRQAHDEVN